MLSSSSQPPPPARLRAEADQLGAVAIHYRDKQVPPTQRATTSTPSPPGRGYAAPGQPVCRRPQRVEFYFRAGRLLRATIFVPRYPMDLSSLLGQRPSS
jgi:hypothetical protein